LRDGERKGEREEWKEPGIIYICWILGLGGRTAGREGSLKLEKKKIERELRETSSTMDHVHVLSGINQT
jgi:hypothetical protein